MIDDPILVNDWHVVARSSDVPESQVIGARLLGTDLVVWRQDGQVMAWRDLCVHRGTRLSLGQVTGLGLECPYHGWTYDPSGSCVHIPSRPRQQPPARACATVYAATEAHGLIWASLGRPEHGVPPYDEWHDPAYRHLLAGPYAFRASAPRVIENFLDITHLPFVHEGILGDRDHAELDDYTVETGPDGITALDIHTWTPNPDGSGEAQMVQWQYRVLRPLTAYILSALGGGPKRYSMFFAVTPIDEQSSLGWMWNSANYNHDMSDEDFGAYIDETVMQDIPIVESQRPELLPLDLQAELHVRADKTGVAYRRWLKELGITFGTS